MNSIIITAKQEPQTVSNLLTFILDQLSSELASFEVIVIAPDTATLQTARRFGSQVKAIKDKGLSKPHAMNLAFSQAKGAKLIFTDGDVMLKSGAIDKLLATPGDLVSGRPVVDKKRQGKYSWWQKILFQAADELRARRAKQGEFLQVSGYLFCIHKEILYKNNQLFQFPENIITEDEYLSYWVYHQGGKINYCAEAQVAVKFPQNVKDFLLQKRRTLGGSYQIPVVWKKGVVMRSFLKEVFYGFSLWKKNIRHIKHLWWMLELYGLRLYVWIDAYVRIKLLHQSQSELWPRVESTK